MEHYNFKINDDFDKKDLKNHINDAMNNVILDNGKNEVEIELEERIINKIFKNYTGVFEKHRVLKSGIIIGYLEVFRNNDYNYLNIYTSPIS
jgi:hypothetical protein